MRRFANYLRGTVAAFTLVAVACSSGPTPEERAKIEGLQAELKLIGTELADAQKKSESYEGGLLKALVDVRLEVLKTTETLLKQRIHALESGAKVKIEITATNADPKLAATLEEEIRQQEKELQKARLEADKAGGLIGVLKQATVATQEQSLAMLRSRHIAAKYGLPSPAIKVSATESAEATEIQTAQSMAASPPSPKKPQDDVGSQILRVRLLSKTFSKQDYQDFIFFDLEYTATGLDKPARALKGVLHLQDLFGESHMKLRWTLEQPIEPGGKLIEKGYGFKYNQFVSDHQWARNTEAKNMTAKFVVQSILYADGTRRDL